MVVQPLVLSSKAAMRVLLWRSRSSSNSCLSALQKRSLLPRGGLPVGDGLVAARMQVLAGVGREHSKSCMTPTDQRLAPAAEATSLEDSAIMCGSAGRNSRLGPCEATGANVMAHER